MKWHLPFAVFLLLSTSAFATEQIRKAQTELKDEGFYFGEVTGESSTEFTAALRRYQIRNGLDVTGNLDTATLEALGIQAAAPVRPIAPKKEAARPAAPPVARTSPPVNLRKDDAAETDQEFLDGEEDRRPNRPSMVPPSDPSVVRRPAPLDDEPVAVPGEEYAGVFAGTPYASAPRVIQDETVRKAQALLARRGFYRDPVDGAPGPATEEAILTYQRSAGLPLTGRLDLQTLAGLRLLPGRQSGANAGRAPMKPFRVPNGSRSGPTRDVWIQ
jgi:peptidoglycan hydrolase-like protein with peptidoglycan-binding domain